MSRVSFLKRFFTVLVFRSIILALVSFASAQDGKADAVQSLPPLQPRRPLHQLQDKTSP